MKTLIALIGLGAALVATAQDSTTTNLLLVTEPGVTNPPVEIPRAEVWTNETQPFLATNLTISVTPRQRAAVQIIVSKLNEEAVSVWNAQNAGKPIDQVAPKPLLITCEEYLFKRAQDVLDSYVRQQDEANLQRVANVLRQGIDTGEFLQRLADNAETNFVPIVEVVSPVIGVTQ